MDWVIKDQLARSPRPGFPSHDVSPEDVDEWIQEAINLGIKTIIVLLHDTQLTWYPRVEEGLLSRYEQAGLDVRHFSILDYKTPPINEEDLPPIFDAFNESSKPVLIHCSAGVDRTGQSIEYILGVMEDAK